MKFSVIITNYNYGRFIVDAVQSAINQTWGLPEIIIVNDGSTDDSAAILDEVLQSGKIAKVINQENTGQLASFAAGSAYASGDVVCFLDADDVFELNYLHELEKVYKKSAGIDFVYCNMKFFGDKEGIYFNDNCDNDEGYSIVFSSYYPYYKASPTSALSIKRSILIKIMSLAENYYSDFKVCADSCLSIGADILGAGKYYLSCPVVGYRFHGNNVFLNKNRSPSQNYKQNVAKRKFSAHCSNYMGVTEEWLALAAEEFFTKSKPRFHELKIYMRMISRSNLSFRGKIFNTVAIYNHYRKCTKV